MRPISRVIALAVALLPLGCAGHVEPPRAVTVAAQAMPAPPAPVWPDAAPVPDTLSPDAAGSGPAPEPGNDQFTAREELPDVHFAPGEIRARRRDLSTLHAVAAWLKANPSQLVIVEGHTDAAGTRAANLALGQRRARWVMDYLVATGVPAERVTVVARGETEALCADPSPACQDRNRRVRFLVRESGALHLSASPSP